MTATAPHGAPPPVDAAHDPHLSGAFEPVIDEIDAGDLEVGLHGAWLPTEE